MDPPLQYCHFTNFKSGNSKFWEKNIDCYVSTVSSMHHITQDEQKWDTESKMHVI